MCAHPYLGNRSHFFAMWCSRIDLAGSVSSLKPMEHCFLSNFYIVLLFYKSNMTYASNQMIMVGTSLFFPHTGFITQVLHTMLFLRICLDKFMPLKHMLSLNSNINKPLHLKALI